MSHINRKKAFISAAPPAEGVSWTLHMKYWRERSAQGGRRAKKSAILFFLRPDREDVFVAAQMKGFGAAAANES